MSASDETSPATSCGHKGCPANQCTCGNCCCWVKIIGREMPAQNYRPGDSA